MDCIFCKLAAGEIPSKKVYEDDSVLVFHDLSPEAPVHVLAIPKAHIGSAADVDGANEQLVGHIFSVLAGLTEQLGLQGGYRIVTNVGQDGGQTVGHLHFHLLGGRALGWPPG